MGLELDRPDLAPLRARLTPYGRLLLERSGDYAVFLHAEEVGAAHLLCTLMDDEECAAHRAVLHAFADPETISTESRAMADGILVVGSVCALPFSVRGVRALFRARELAVAQGASEVGAAHLAASASRELAPELQAELEQAGWKPAALLESSGASRAEAAFAPAAGEALFRHFSNSAKRVLSAAGRAAGQAKEASISPAQILLACLQVEPELGRLGELPYHRARRVLLEKTVDPTPLEERALPPDRGLLEFLGRLPAPDTARFAGSLELLANFHSPETPELALLLTRNKVTRALLERAAVAFEDPEVA
jgi:ATP-dependent Clp protease ATP-binding subunit ClpA